MDLKSEIGARGKKAFEYLTNRIEELVQPEDPLRHAALHYLKAGGKGFRPAMLMLVCGALGGNENQSLPAAAAIEAVHISSLLHDDLMDNDEMRRGVTAAWKEWSPTIAILAGDVLLGVAYAIVGEITGLSYELRYKISNDLAKVYVELCHGQMLDIDFTESKEFTDVQLDQISEMQYLKTGVLFEFACVTGARIALNSVTDELIDRVREYAKLAGTAFQIQDDIIGLMGDQEEIGKPVGSDILEGKRTIVAVHAITHANEADKALLLDTLGNAGASKNQLDDTLELMIKIGSVDYAKNLAFELAKKAKEIAEQLPTNSYSDLLRQFAMHMIERKF